MAHVNKKKKEQGGTKTLVLLDAHAILHRAYHALPDFSSSKGEPTGALYGIIAMLMKIVRELKPDYIVACYDLPGPTFRHQAYDDYKAGRQKADEALIAQIKRSRDIFAAFNIPIYECPGFEADDMLGTIVEQAKKEKDMCVIIASGDMDTLQLVDNDRVTVYTLRKGIRDTVLYDEKGVNERYQFPPQSLPDYKGLAGDPSDNIIGISGIGEKTATTLISQFGSLEHLYKVLKKDEQKVLDTGIKPRIVELLKKGEEEAMFSKTLATIRRDAPITFTIPSHTWNESFDIKKAEALLAELEFRALRERVRELVGGKAEENQEAGESSENAVPSADTSVSETELEEMKILMWLINSDMAHPSAEDILAFTRAGTLASARPILEAEIKKRDLAYVFEHIERPLMPVIREAEKKGILIDPDYFNTLSKNFHKELSSIEAKIWKEAGEEFNINSPKQLGDVLFDKLGLTAKGLKKTSGGARSTRESELLKLKEEHKIIDDILAYRELQKLLSTYVDVIPAMAGVDGRLHTNLNQTGTTTGRMSSSNPNLQNIPVKEGLGMMIRNGFIAPKGYKLVAFDYSQIEIRVLAQLSGDETLQAIFKEGKDVHANVAARVFGVPEQEVTKDMRRKAKVINFGIIYGMGVNALRANLGSTRAETQEFYNQYFETFPLIEMYFEKVKAEARKNGYTKTLFGRRRMFEGIKSRIPYIKAQAERMAMNAPLQGTAADIMKIATVEAHKAIKKNNLQDEVQLLLSVHDELIYEIKENAIGRAVPVIQKAMEHIERVTVPLVVNVSVGPSWGELRSYNA
jgi:DNA polymerase-1